MSLGRFSPAQTNEVLHKSKTELERQTKLARAEKVLSEEQKQKLKAQAWREVLKNPALGNKTLTQLIEQKKVSDITG